MFSSMVHVICIVVMLPSQMHELNVVNSTRV